MDILASSAEPEKIMTEFCQLPDIDRILGKGPTKSSIVLTSGVQVDLRVVDNDQYWTALQYFTGSKAHNIAMRRRALDRNWKLNEYGVTSLSDGKILPGKTEQDLYRMLDLPYIEPELREDRGEIEAASHRESSRYCSLWSGEGRPSCSLFMERRKTHDQGTGRGRKGITVMNILPSVIMHGIRLVARGIDETAVAQQHEEIEQINRDLDGFEVLAGIECTINDDGNLDIGNKILGDLDVVVASIHSGLDMPRAEMTNRVLAALNNDQVDILGHPTGRIMQKREPAQLDLAVVFDAAAERGVALEINAFPSRLDLSDINCRMAREHRARFSIGSDAHSREDLAFMELGVATARRGWLEEKDIINTLHLRDLLKVLES